MCNSCKDAIGSKHYTSDVIWARERNGLLGLSGRVVMLTLNSLTGSSWVFPILRIGLFGLPVIRYVGLYDGSCR